MRRRDASPKAMGDLRQRVDLPCKIGDAFTPTPEILPATDILFDAWALTTIREKLPGRPPVEPYLHGISDWQRPETQVAWREDVSILTDDLLGRDTRDDLLDEYPLKPHELLHQSSDRVLDDLVAISRRMGNCIAVWLIDEGGQVSVKTLGELLDADKRAVLGRIAHCTVLLPPSVGGLTEHGTFDGTRDFDPGRATSYDIADDWFADKAKTVPRRIRIRDDDPRPIPPEGMRPIRTIDTVPAGDEDDGREPTGRRYWHWYELAKVGENEGSESATEPVRWQDHTDKVVAIAEAIAGKLGLSEELKQALSLAARFHDWGKRREVWQRSIGNPDPTTDWLAKSSKGMRTRDICPDYRHEFGSLLDIQDAPESAQLSDERRDLVMHLIAATHGRGRPHFASDEVFDLTPRRTQAAAQLACEVPRRFARLQRRYGRWGLAYLESLLRAADWAASATPRADVDEPETRS